jgi:hypothetical protein
LGSVDYADLFTQFRGIEERMGMQFGGCWFPGKLPKFGSKELLSRDIDILITENYDTSLGDCKVRLE